MEANFKRSSIFVCSQSRPHWSGCPCPSPHLKGAGFAAQDLARVRDSNAAQGSTQDMRATLAESIEKEGQGCNEAPRPSQPAPRAPSSRAIVTSQPWIQLTGGCARWGAVPGGASGAAAGGEGRLLVPRQAGSRRGGRQVSDLIVDWKDLLLRVLVLGGGRGWLQAG